MKIVVEFIRAEQHWSPDTGSQQNFLVFGFGGREHRIPCAEEDVVNAVREAQQGPPAPPVPELAAEEHYQAALQKTTAQMSEASRAEISGDVEFGGDFAPEIHEKVNPPITFEVAPEEARPVPPLSSEQQRKGMIAEVLGGRPRSKEKLSAERLERMRKIARSAPYNTKMTADEMGNPIVPQRVVAPGTGAQPTIVRRAQASGGGDDDPFPQG